MLVEGGEPMSKGVPVKIGQIQNNSLNIIRRFFISWYGIWGYLEAM